MLSKMDEWQEMNWFMKGFTLCFVLLPPVLTAGGLGVFLAMVLDWGQLWEHGVLCSTTTLVGLLVLNKWIGLVAEQMNEQL